MVCVDLRFVLGALPPLMADTFQTCACCCSLEHVCLYWEHCCRHEPSCARACAFPYPLLLLLSYILMLAFIGIRPLICKRLLVGLHALLLWLCKALPSQHLYLERGFFSCAPFGHFCVKVFDAFSFAALPFWGLPFANS